MTREREFDFTDREFRAIRDLVSAQAGIVLSEAKRDMIYGRLVRRLRALDLDNFGAYCELLDSQDGAGEMEAFVNAVTTNLTSFFREAHHFEYLAQRLLPSLLQSRAGTRRLRIWSAGCSTGEEPYSLAMTLRDAIPRIDGWDVKILATDIDTNVLATAAAGVYGEERVRDLPQDRLRRWFRKGKGSCDGKVKVSRELQDMISFRQLNLLGAWPMRGSFDVIFCRNVVIYFDKPTQKKLFERMADQLASDGHLFIGHSESLFKVTDRFRTLGNTIYERAA